MKYIMQMLLVSQKCKLCEKIDAKQRRRTAEAERILRWRREGGKFTASIDPSLSIVKTREKSSNDLASERQYQQKLGGEGLIGANPIAIPITASLSTKSKP